MNDVFREIAGWETFTLDPDDISVYSKSLDKKYPAIPEKNNSELGFSRGVNFVWGLIDDTGSVVRFDLGGYAEDVLYPQLQVTFFSYMVSVDIDPNVLHLLPRDLELTMVFKQDRELYG